MNDRTAQQQSPATLRSLGRAIGRRCRGRTLVLGQSFPELMVRLDSQGIESVARSLGDSAGGRFDTVVLVRALEYESGERTDDWLSRAWEQVAPQGKLLVCVPNGDQLEDSRLRRRFTRRALKQALKKIDQPKIFTDQPFRWLLMAVDSDTSLDRPTDDRHRVIADLCRGRVIELGCAAGHLCNRIAEAGLSVRGVDKNAAKIAKAQRLFPALDFEQADILELGVEQRYDTVVLAEVLEHLTNEIGDRVLARAWELVAPGGRLIVGVPNEDCIRHANHLREFTLDGLIELLSDFGRPGVVSDQPYRWLLAFIDRTAEEKAAVIDAGGYR